MKLYKKYNNGLHYVMLGEEVLFETAEFVDVQVFYSKIHVADKYNELIDHMNEINLLIGELIIQYQDENEDVIKKLKKTITK